jgi:ribosomal-protein-alanine N-acetyltransferase
VLHPDQWKKGIMKEAATAIIKYGWEALGLHSMEAHIDPENKASAALLLSLGFEKEAYFRENFCYNGKFLDTEIYGLINPGDKRGGESKTEVDTMPNRTNPS